ncbi:MAG: glycosyltransferase family 2 protein [Candidatus Dechloromonas phosphoritropha]
MSPVNMDQSSTIELSIVTTMYQSEGFIAEFHRLSTEAANGFTSSYEIIFVNDGSPDDSLERSRALVEVDAHVRVVDLSRNFGHHRALLVGIEHARGRLVFLIDCDLEENPLTLSEFATEMKQTKADVVYGVQTIRKGGIVRKIGGVWFWSLFNLISEVKVTPNVITSRLMTRRYVNALLGFRERELFLSGIFALTGFKQVPMVVKKVARSGTSYTIRKRFALLVNAITSFSSRPLLLVFYLGLAISLVSGISAAGLLVTKLMSNDFAAGWPSLIVSIWLIGGITIFCLGLIGIYIAKVFQEVKDRPLSIIRDIYENTNQKVSTSMDLKQ